MTLYVLVISEMKVLDMKIISGFTIVAKGKLIIELLVLEIFCGRPKIQKRGEDFMDPS